MKTSKNNGSKQINLILRTSLGLSQKFPCQPEFSSSLTIIFHLFSFLIFDSSVLWKVFDLKGLPFWIVRQFRINVDHFPFYISFPFGTLNLNCRIFVHFWDESKLTYPNEVAIWNAWSHDLMLFLDESYLVLSYCINLNA